MRLLPLLLVACNATVVDEYEICSLEVSFEPASGAPGDTIVITGTPFTEARDTRVQVGGVRAEVDEVKRVGVNACEGVTCVTSGDCGCSDGATCEEGQCVAPDNTYYCDECDRCRDAAGCPPCGVCQGLDLEPSERTLCFGDPLSDGEALAVCDQCVETIEFVVPPLPAGVHALVVINRNGQSDALAFEVLPGSAPTGDTGDTDTGDTDTGTPDTGDTDTGDAPNTGDTGDAPNTADTGGTDTGTADTGTADTGSSDTGTSETGGTGI